MKSEKQKKATVGAVIGMVMQLSPDERRMLSESLARTVAADAAASAADATVKAENAPA